MPRLTVLAASIAVLTAVLASTSSQAATPGRWVIRDLGTLGGELSWANAVNARGEAVGASELGSCCSYRAFLWQKGKMRRLGTLGGEDSQALAINERGQIAGSSETTSRGNHAVLWESGKTRDLGRGTATDVSDRGQVVGWMEMPGGLHHAFLWQNGRVRDLGMLPGDTQSEALAINERGQVVGWSGRGDGGDVATRNSAHAFLWQSGKMRDLGTLGGRRSWANAINDRGQVVGYGERKAGRGHAFLWQKGTMRDLGTLGRSRNRSEAYGINDRGQVVGEAENGRTREWEGDSFPISRAFVWERGTIRDLGALGGPTSAARAINKSGQIAGQADYSGAALANRRTSMFGETYYTAVLWTYKP
jgi:probable HAF family extracellular repeat protein